MNRFPLSVATSLGGLMQVNRGLLPKGGAVAAEVFGLIERLVAARDQLAWLFVADRVGRHDARAVWIRAATCSAPSRPVLARMMANSSPP